MVFDEKLAVTYIVVPLYIMCYFTLAALRIFFVIFDFFIFRLTMRGVIMVFFGS